MKILDDLTSDATVQQKVVGLIPLLVIMSVLLVISGAYSLLVLSFCGFSSGYSFECSFLPVLSLVAFVGGVFSINLFSKSIKKGRRFSWLWILLFIFSLFPVHAPLFTTVYNAIPPGYILVWRGKGPSYCASISADNIRRELCYYSLSSGGYPIRCDSIKDNFVKARCEGDIKYCETISNPFPSSMDEYWSDYRGYRNYFDPSVRYQCFFRAATWRDGDTWRKTLAINEWKLVSESDCLKQSQPMRDFCLFNAAIGQRKLNLCDDISSSDFFKNECKALQNITK
jgi:hypothetical protein